MDTGKIYVALELCSLGSLESYLRKHRPQAYENIAMEMDSMR